MLEINNENNATTARILDDDCKIHLQESENLLETGNSQMCIEFNDLCYSIRNRKGTKKILRNVTGHFEPGKLTVIIGPSGAGKTTLLEIITGNRLFNIKGTVTVNNGKWNRETFRKQVCYVPQQFQLLPLLTTRETLYIAARFKLDANQNKQSIYLIVNEIAESLNLSNCLDTMANKLSGGERKRLSIGVEMITKPHVFLLDEPTSGLDSMTSNQLINMLHGRARMNCTVVCVIHQPSSQMISLFDNIIILDQGRSIYCGPKSEIINTFNTAGYTCPNFYNITEFVLEVITGQRGGDLNNLYKICRDEYDKFKSGCKDHEEASNLPTIFKQKHKIDDTIIPINNTVQKKSMWQEQKILFLRALICIKRDILMTKLRIIVHIIIGLLLGLVFYDFGYDAEKVLSNVSYLFFIMIFIFFANAMTTVHVFPTEAAVFLQEHLNNWYSLRSYYIVKILTEFPLQIICSSSFLFISYYMTGQPMVYDRILKAWSISILLTILAQMIGSLCGTALHPVVALFLIPSVNVPFALFAGFFVKIEEMSEYLQPLGTLSYYRYAFEGLMQAVYLDRENLLCSELYCHFRSPNKILDTMGLLTVPFYVTLIILGFWIFCLHITLYSVFYWKIYYAKK
ncbi:hypothetical protein P5V15_005440 [Pogonomyrmex californicus]